MISAIIPYGNRYEALSVLLETLSYEELEGEDVFVVSLGDDDSRVKPLCDKYGFNYIFVPHEGTFKIGVCLNVGCECAKTEYVLKLDVDCVPYQGFFRKLKEHLSSDTEFSLLSVVYASQGFTERKLQSPPFNEDLLKEALLPGNNVNFHYGRPSGTMFLVKRDVFSVHGKVSQEFTGHGYEDYQILANLISLYRPNFIPMRPSVRFYRRASMYYNRKTNNKSLILMHRWHERDFNDVYYSLTKNNERFLLEYVWTLYEDKKKND
jgi:predicted glycosyltransferase involved in capsule biosynthesis